MLGLVGALVLVEEAAAAHLLKKAARGLTYPYPTPSLQPLSPLPVPPTQGQPNRKLEGKGTLEPEMSASQGKMERGFRGQQDYPRQT